MKISYYDNKFRITYSEGFQFVFTLENSNSAYDLFIGGLNCLNLVEEVDGCGLCGKMTIKVMNALRVQIVQTYNKENATFHCAYCNDLSTVVLDLSRRTP